VSIADAPVCPARLSRASRGANIRAAVPADASTGESVDGGQHDVTIGIVDEPRRQRRGAAVIDLAADGNLLVDGGTGAGKTTVLRTLVGALAAQTAHRRAVALRALPVGGAQLRRDPTSALSVSASLSNWGPIMFICSMVPPTLPLILTPKTRPSCRSGRLVAAHLW